MNFFSRSFIVAVALALPLTACSKPSSPGSVLTASAVPSAPLPPSSKGPVPLADAGMAHDPAHPPIDCPLAKQGLTVDHLRPFEDVEKYIAFLERPDRALWQKPGEVIDALQLKGTETLYDLGAGSGYFAFRFARALPNGRVVAGDPQAEMIRHIHHRAMSEGIRNLEVKLTEPGNPAVPAEADWVFLCDVLHHVPGRAAWLSKLADQMKPGARLALIEFKQGKLPQGPPESAKIPRDELLRLVTAAGFVRDAEHTELLPYQVFFVLRKPE